MRKLVVVLLALLVLTGCGSSVTEVSNPDEEIISGSTSLTRQELYELMKLSDYSTIILIDLAERIAGFEGVDVDTIEEEFDEALVSLQETYGDSYDSIMSLYGGESSYRLTYLYSELLEALTEKYVEYNFDDLAAEYEPVLVLLQEFEDETEAQAMIDNINSGMTFAEASEEAGIETAATETVYTANSDLDTELLELFADGEVGLVDEPVVVTTESTDDDGNETTTYTYYVVEIVSIDASEFFDEFYSSISGDITTAVVFNYYFSKYTIEVYDQDVYDYLSENYEGIN